MGVPAIGEELTYGTPKSADYGEPLGKNEFLKLLITQLKYQDPLNPMDNTEFVAQLASFSTLEQMQNMNSSLEKMMAMQGLAQMSQLIGRNVKLGNVENDLDFDDAYITGVAGISVVGGEIKLILSSGATAEMSDVLEIYADEVPEETETGNETQ